MQLFGVADNQMPMRFEVADETAYDPILRFVLEIDESIPAKDDIKRGVDVPGGIDEIQLAEIHLVAELWLNAVAAGLRTVATQKESLSKRDRNGLKIGFE